MTESINWEAFEPTRIAPRNPSLLKHAELVRLVKQVQAHHPAALTVRRLGESFEGRAIHRIGLGRGPKKILLWTQMHGDEPTHTAVLLNLLNYFQRGDGNHVVEEILTGCTLQMILMLNPDGAERDIRQNAQGIDVNRDARELQSPEARILKTAVAEFRPDFAFNLHDQDPRNFVETTGEPAAVSLMVPPLDPDGTETEQIVTVEKIAVCFYQAVVGYCRDRIGRYAAQYMPGAFGEAVQQHGAATVLVEAGGWPPDCSSSLMQIHFVGLLLALEAIATDAYQDADPGYYDSLPMTVRSDSNHPT